MKNVLRPLLAAAVLFLMPAAMAYAQSPKGRAKIDSARKQLAARGAKKKRAAG